MIIMTNNVFVHLCLIVSCFVLTFLATVLILHFLYFSHCSFVSFPLSCNWFPQLSTIHYFAITHPYTYKINHQYCIYIFTLLFMLFWLTFILCKWYVNTHSHFTFVLQWNSLAISYHVNYKMPPPMYNVINTMHTHPHAPTHTNK